MKISTLSLFGALAGMALVGVPTVAQAQSRVAYTLADTGLYTGPHNSYPQISYVPGRDTVQVYGCLNDWSWCDVRWRGERGWMDADYLSTNYYGNAYGDRYSIWYSSGNNLGLPTVSFLLGAYWNDHYRHRNWYRNYDYWQHYRPPVYHRPPRDRDHGPRDWNRDGRPDHWQRDGRDGNRDRTNDRRDNRPWDGRTNGQGDNRPRNDRWNDNRNDRPGQREGDRDNRGQRPPTRMMTTPQPARPAPPAINPRTAETRPPMIQLPQRPNNMERPSRQETREQPSAPRHTEGQRGQRDQHSARQGRAEP